MTLPHPLHAKSRTRRQLGGDLLALLSAGLFPVRAEAGNFDDPPPLYSRAAQFTLLDPLAPMPSIKLKRLDGRPADLAPVPGKVMLVNFWASWCPACGTELPKLEILQAVMRDDLAIAAVALDKAGRDVVAPYLRKRGLDDLNVFLDPEGRSVKSASEPSRGATFELYGMPTSYVITRGGLVAGYISGAVDWDGGPARRLLDYYGR